MMRNVNICCDSNNIYAKSEASSDYSGLMRLSLYKMKMEDLLWN